MKYSKIFNGKMDGPYEFRYKRNNKETETRPCYIINRYVSGLFNVYCPEFKYRDWTLDAEFNLAKSIDWNEESFVAFGKENYF